MHPTGAGRETLDDQTLNVPTVHPTGVWREFLAVTLCYRQKRQQHPRPPAIAGQDKSRCTLGFAQLLLLRACACGENNSIQKFLVSWFLLRPHTWGGNPKI